MRCHPTAILATLLVTALGAPACAGTWGVLTYDGARRAVEPYLSSLAGGEEGTGAVRSAPFTIPPGVSEYRFLANGWDGPGNQRGLSRFQLCDADTGRELRRASPPGNDAFTEVVWRVEDLAGRRVYFRAEDRVAEPAFAWMGCRQIPLGAMGVASFTPRRAPEHWFEEVDGALRPLGRPGLGDPRRQIEADWEDQDRALGIRWGRWREGPDAAHAQRDLVLGLLTNMLDRAQRLLADYASYGGLTPEARASASALAPLRVRLAHLARRPALPEEAPRWRALYHDTRVQVRRLAFANPLLRPGALLFVQRYTQQSYADVNVNHHAWGSSPGGDICILSPIRPDGRVRRLLRGRLGPGNVHGIDLSWDGRRVLFAYARSAGPDPPDGWTVRQRTFDLHRTVDLYHLYEIGVDGRGLRQITRGPWSDLNPCYLPGGRIAFESERCGFELECNELDKDEPTTNLYVMNGDGTGVRRLSVTKDGDWYPRVLNDGRIVYSHWEYHERDWTYMHPLWTLLPDGTGAGALFKQHINLPATLTAPRAIPGSPRVMAVATGHHTLAAGPIVLVDPRVGMNNPQGIQRLTGPARWPEYSTPGPVPGPSLPGWRPPPGDGWYMDPWPLSERYFLAAYCDGGMQDESGYALYLLDVYGGKELVYCDPTISNVMPVPLRARPEPPILANACVPRRRDAVCLVTDIHQGVEGVARGTIRYLRISEPVPWPYTNAQGGGRFEPDAKAQGTSWTPIRILGTVPVEADGSACFRVPADTALYFQALDADLMDVRRMRSYVSLQPGEIRACVGCHETRAQAPRVAASPVLALRRPPMAPQPPPWGAVPLSFLRDVQPVLDRHCVRCHTGLAPAGGVDLSPGLTLEHNRAYDTLVPGRTPTLVSVSNKHDDARVSPPRAFGSSRSLLLRVLESRAHRSVRLSAADRMRLITWIDTNAVYHDRMIEKRLAGGVEPYNLAADEALWREVRDVQKRRCAGCHASTSVARPEWVDLREPGHTLFLAAPLAHPAGGMGACKPAPFQGTADPDYQTLLRLVKQAVRRTWERPRRDLVSCAGAPVSPLPPRARRKFD